MSLLNFDDNKKFSNHSGRGISIRKTLKTILGIGALVGVVTFGSTLAASINLNSNGPVEFGQGVAQTSACDNSITVTPTSHFANDSEGGSFALSTITLSGIDSSSEHCYGKTFTIKGYGETGGALDLVMGVGSVEVTAFGDSFGLAGSPSGVSIGSIDGTEFTLTFNTDANPVSAADVYQITIESTAVGSLIVSSISDPIQASVASTSSYTITTFNIADGASPEIIWFTGTDGLTETTAPTGISISGSNISSNSSTQTVSATGSSEEGTYYFKVNVIGNVSSVIALSVGPAPSYSVGEISASGGKVFYKQVSAFTMSGAPCGTNCHYLEVAPKTWSGGVTDPAIWWGASNGYASSHLLGTGSTLGTGYSNTTKIIEREGGNAAEATRNYAGPNGQTAGEWFLPSKTELLLLRDSSVYLRSDFYDYWYWTSTQLYEGAAWFLPMNSSGGFDNYWNEDSTGRVRAIRAF